MGTIANAKVTHYYNCYNGDFIGCLLMTHVLTNIKSSLKHFKEDTFSNFHTLTFRLS